MKSRTENHGDAYEAVKYVYDKSPGRSWRRLNEALQSTLHSAIVGHLSFLPGDFLAMVNDMNGGYWMGNSQGSTCGEGYYGLAVKVGHTPACISFEQYDGRPAALWAEKVKTPERLCIGAEFTWEGLRVTVTNMRRDHLIACTYGAREASREPLEVGAIDYLGGGYRTVEHFKRLDDGSLIIRMSAARGSRDCDVRKPERVIRIAYDALASVRKTADATRRQRLKEIAAVENPKALVELAQLLSVAGRGAYRHFDIEDFRSAIRAKEQTFAAAEVARVRALSEAEQLDRWSAGENVGGWFSTVRLRVAGRYVETSTGHSVSVESVKKVLPFVLEHRRVAVAPNGLEVDIHPVKRISEDGVLIGCTLIPWPEVDRLAGLLQCCATRSAK